MDAKAVKKLKVHFPLAPKTLPLFIFKPRFNHSPRAPQVAELKSELKKLGLPTDGLKAVLVARLTSALESSANEEVKDDNGVADMEVEEKVVEGSEE